MAASSDCASPDTAGRENHFDELPLEDRPRGGGIDLSIEGDDAAERGGRVGAISLLVGGGCRGGDRDAAGIRVLDDDARRRLELPHALERGVAVRDVVVRKLLALQLPGACATDAPIARGSS